MLRFSGEHECRLDAKARLALPAKIKAALPEENGDQVVLTRGFEPCIVLRPLTEWNKILERVAGLDEFTEEYRTFQRNFLRGNTEVELDTAGRFVLPRMLAKYAGIDKEVVVIGVGRSVELWSPENYEQHMIKDPSEMSRLAQRVMSGKGPETPTAE
jgi:MraZ protein